MGAKQAKPIVEYSSLTLQKRELTNLQRDFKALSRSDNYQTGKISRDTFVGQVLAPGFGTFGGVVLSRLFAVLDTNGNGSIEWQEYVVACYLLYYSDREDKMKLMFTLFDLEANGRISKKDFKKISIALMQKDDDPTQIKRLNPLIEMFVTFTMLNFDRHNESAIRYNDWRRYAEDDDLILAMISCMKKPEEIDKRKEDKQRSSFARDRKISTTSPMITTTTTTTSLVIPTETKLTSTDSSLSNSNFGSSMSSGSGSSIDSLSSTGTTGVPHIAPYIELSLLSPSLEQTQGNLVSLPRPLRISTTNSVK